jgi:type VI secretion system protein ImpH
MDLIAQMKAAPHRFRFFQAIRLVSLAEPSSPIRFRTPASLAFPPSEIQSLTDTGAARDMVVGFFGLTGPAGVLPQHYTERLLESREARQDPAAHAFLDLFSHRALTLFYGAWRKYRFAIGLEQGETRGFTRPLLALAGLPPTEGGPLARVLARSAGPFSQRRLSASALAGMLGAHFGLPLVLEQFIGRWGAVPDRDQARLAPDACGLAGATLLGLRLWDRQTGIRIRLGPLPLPAFLDFLPRAPGFQALGALVQAAVGHSLACDLTLVLMASAVPPPVLGTGNARILGHNLWLSSHPTERERDDARFRLLQ